jgi:hypothetical protein
VVADGTSAQVKALASGRVLRARLPSADQDQLTELSGLSVVESVELRGDTVVVRGRDTDAVARYLLTLQSTLGYSPVRNGVAFLPMVGTLMVMAQLSTNWLVPRVGPKVIVPVGMLLAAGSMVWLTRLGLHSSYVAPVLPPLLLLGAGLGLSMPAVMSRATLGVQLADQGVASATVNTTQQVGGAISTALLNTLAAGAATRYAAHHPTDPLVQANAALHSYATAYWWSGGFFAFATLVTVLLFRRNRASLSAVLPATAMTTYAGGTADIHRRMPDGAGAPVRTADAHDHSDHATAVGLSPVGGGSAITGRVEGPDRRPVVDAVLTVTDLTARQMARGVSDATGGVPAVVADRGNVPADLCGRRPPAGGVAGGGGRR